MKALQNLIGNSTYMVVDNPANSFNFVGLVEVDDSLLYAAEAAQYYTEWDLTEDLPEDVQMAIAVMKENDVLLQDYTGVVTFDTDEETYYLLTW